MALATGADGGMDDIILKVPLFACFGPFAFQILFILH